MSSACRAIKVAFPLSPVGKRGNNHKLLYCLSGRGGKYCVFFIFVVRGKKKKYKRAQKGCFLFLRVLCDVHSVLRGKKDQTRITPGISQE